MVNGSGSIRSVPIKKQRLLGSDETALHDCFLSTDLEPVTARDWWNSSVLPVPFPDRQGDRINWIRDRQPTRPMVGDDTMIVGVLYTFDASILKMNIFFPPLYPQESRRASITIKTIDNVNSTGATAECNIREHIWYFPIRIAELTTNHDYEYQVQYAPDPTNHPRRVYIYKGRIPKQKSYPRIAGLGCFGADDSKEKNEFVQAMLDSKPDLVVLQGDQTYMDNIGYGFLELIYTINNITRNVPTLVQMDDHDYHEPNLWGAGYGKQTSGKGFHRPVCLINALQELYLSHMPETAATNKTLDNGIDIYYTSYRYGATEFAVLESRKFKSQWPGSLLGSDQEAWLKGWCARENRALRLVLTQTPFAALATNATRLSSPFGIGPTYKSTDSNGFPFSGRQRFMEIAKGCAPLVLSGDQHLGAAVTYDDFGVSECASPAAINDVFWRFNFDMAGRNETRLDAWGNQYRMLYAWNAKRSVYQTYKSPYKTRYASASVKAARADGFLVVKLDGKSATCEMHSYRESHKVVLSATLPTRKTGLLKKRRD